MTPDSGTRRCREHPTQEDGSGRSPGTGRSLCRYLTPAIISPAFHCVQSSDRGRPVTPAPGPAATVPTGGALRAVLLAQTDCETLRSVALALGQEPLEACGRDLRTSVSQKTLVRAEICAIRGILGVIRHEPRRRRRLTSCGIAKGSKFSPNVLFPRTEDRAGLLPARNPAWLSGPGWSGDESLSFCVPASAGSTRCDAGWPPAPTRPTVRAKPSAPWLRTRSSPRCSNPLMADSIAGCARRAANKRLLLFPFPVGS